MTVYVPDIQSLNWSPQLENFGEVVENIDDIEQCLNIILKTPKGADPHRPDFASDIFQYLDYPQTEIKQQLIRSAFEALTTWEPRIEIVYIDVNFINNPLGRIEVLISWKVKNSIQQQLTVVIV